MASHAAIIHKQDHNNKQKAAIIHKQDHNNKQKAAILKFMHATIKIKWVDHHKSQPWS